MNKGYFSRLTVETETIPCSNNVRVIQDPLKPLYYITANNEIVAAQNGMETDFGSTWPLRGKLGSLYFGVEYLGHDELYWFGRVLKRRQAGSLEPAELECLVRGIMEPDDWKRGKIYEEQFGIVKIGRLYCDYLLDEMIYTSTGNELVTRKQIHFGLFCLGWVAWWLKRNRFRLRAKVHHAIENRKTRYAGAGT